MFVRFLKWAGPAWATVRSSDKPPPNSTRSSPPTKTSHSSRTSKRFPSPSSCWLPIATASNLSYHWSPASFKHSIRFDQNTGADRCLTFSRSPAAILVDAGVAKVQERSGIRQLTLPAQPRDPMRGDIVEEVLRAMLFARRLRDREFDMDTTHGGARLTAPSPGYRKRPFTTHADRLTPASQRRTAPSRWACRATHCGRPVSLRTSGLRCQNPSLNRSWPSRCSGNCSWRWACSGLA